MLVSTSVIAELCVYILTWNVASQRPDGLNMNDMLSLNGRTTCPNGQLPDLYVLGFQEAKVDAKQIFHSSEHRWTSKINEHLSFRDYVSVGTEQLQGILITVWSQAKHLPYISDVETSVTKTGFLNLWGNKGAVSLRMNLYNAGTTFVVAHLAAHDEKLKDRIADYNKIVHKHHYKAANYPSINSHDFVFWTGDLNFRLDGQDSAKVISNKVRENRLEELFALDQLERVKRSGEAFSELSEAIPTFPPTFKFHKGTSDYNLKRRPAWCDRVLYKVTNRNTNLVLNMKQLSYKSHAQYILSDHKPVTAEFLLSIKADRR